MAGIFEAKDKAFETEIQADCDCSITKGPGFNVFIGLTRILLPSNQIILEGISSKTMIEIAKMPKSQ